MGIFVIRRHYSGVILSEAKNLGSNADEILRRTERSSE
jgi:hypothetical protein